MKKVLIAILFVAVLVAAPTTVYATDPPTVACDYVDENDGKFFGMDSTWNGTHWIAPEYYRLWHNASAEHGMNTPPVENQTFGFEFNVSSDGVPCNFFVIIQNLHSAEPEGYIGPDYKIQGFASSGVLIAHSNFTYVQSITGYVNESYWNESGWFMFWVAYSWFNVTGNISVHDSYKQVFFLNVTSDHTTTNTQTQNSNEESDENIVIYARPVRTNIVRYLPVVLPSDLKIV